MVKKLEPNVEIIPSYRLIRFLGQGGFGEVWEVEAPGGLAKAIKVAAMNNSEDALNGRELAGLQKIRSIRHPYLLSIERFEVIDGYLVIVMELADKSLADRFSECVREGLPGIPRDELLRYMREAAEVLDLLNVQHGLQHLDVKPENLFLSGGHVKVADFGLVQPGKTTMSRSAMAISPPYAAPELFDGRVEPTADQYSLAVTYQELLTGTRPFDAPDVRGLIYQLLKGRPDMAAVPAADRLVIGRAIQRDPERRYANCTEFVEALYRACAFGVPEVPAPREGERASVPTKLPTIRVPLRPRTMAAASKQAPREQARVKTLPFASRATRVESLDRLPNIGEAFNENKVHLTFVAFLPLEIFAHKLRGFLDALDGELVSCTNDRTVIRLGSNHRNWLGLRSTRGIFLELDTYSPNPHSGYRVVDAKVWSTERAVRGHDLCHRGMLLIRCLKAFLMAVDDEPARPLTIDAELRAAIVE